MAEIADLSRFVLGLGVAMIVYASAFATWVLVIRQPAWRRMVARSTLIGVLVLPLVCWIAPFGRVNWLSALGMVAEDLGLTIPLFDASVWFKIEIGFIVLMMVAISLAAGWAVLGWLAARWITRSASEPDAELIALYTSVNQRAPKPTRLRVSNRLNRPVLIGFFRPTIILPASLVESGDQERMRLALLHELAHVKAGDFSFHGIATLARVVGVLLPPVWIVQEQLRLDHEFLADKQAIEGYGTPRSYAIALLEWAAGLRTRLSRIGSTALPGTSPNGSALSQRIAMLVSCPFPVASRAPAWWGTLVILSTMAGLLGASTLSLGSTKPSATRPISASSLATPINIYQAQGLRLNGSQEGADGRGRPSPLPIPLSETFQLDMTVEATLPEIGTMRLAGYLIPIELGPDGDDVAYAPIETHHLRLKRTEHELRIWLDGIPLSEHPVLPAYPTRLTLEAGPDTQILIHELTVTW